MDLVKEYSEYKEYIDEFAKTINPHDQLPLRVAGYCLRDYEIHGEILEWLMTYLGKSCPVTFRIYLIQLAIQRTLEKVKDSPVECGFDENRNVYQPLKLVRIVVAVVNEIILDLQDNSKLYEVPLPPTSSLASELTQLKAPPKYSVDAIKNSRRTMEDKHMIIDDFNGYFNTQDTEPTFYYGIFDGHSGSDAASYANSHLNYNIAVHPKYPSDITTAMREAFLVTDIAFLKKAKAENLNSGTTALCAMYRKTEKKLYIGWCGDSQALIARVGNVRQIVKKHSPEDESERLRIEKLGGAVLYWGNSYRVNGALSVSRAIGDMMHKPFLSAEPEIECIDLDGEEDFIVLGCDGLWDNLTEDEVAIAVYKKLRENPDNYRSIASDLCSLAKEQGSRDNISVIVVYLKDPQLIATQSWPSTFQEQSKNMENFNIYEHQEQPVANSVTMDALGNTNQDIYNNPFGDFNNQFISDVAMGKASEISDLVTQQQPVCNITETMTNNLNNINNNKFNNGHDEMEKNFVVDDGLNFDQPSSQQPQEAANILVLNDDNNNSNNDNFSGPETDVDAIDDDVPLNASLGAVGGAKEKIQMEFKETEDFTDQAAENVNFGVDNSAAIYGTLENKIFEELSLHNPDMIEGNNPFESIDDSNVLKEAAKFASAPVMEEFIDNKTFEQEIHEMSDFVEKAQKFGMEEEFNKEIIGAVDELKSATDDEVAMQQQPQIDLGFIESTQQQQQQQAIGESGGEESEDEWNYIEGDKKSSDNNLAAVKKNSEKVESTLTEERQETEGEQLGKFIEHEQQFNSSIKDCKAVKEIAEEHFKEEVENKLPLTIDTEESDEMSQLNPDAKEFIPVSPSRELFNNMSLNSPPLNGQMNPIINNLVNEDIVVSQSPRKGEFQPMEDVIIPSEQDFDTECSSRPHEFDSSSPIENRDVPQIMNLKESQQRDDKLEHEYKDEAFFEEEKRQSSEDYKVLEKSFSDYSNGFQNVIDDPMNRSFYEGREGDVLLATAGDVLNTLQPIPTFEDEQPEADHQNFTTESDKPEADHLECQITSESILSFTQETKDDQFEAEQFVEEIKSASEVADKYNDVGLSPQLPEVTFNTVQTTVDEPIKAEMELIEQIQETVPAAVESSPLKDIPSKEIEEAKESLMTEQKAPVVEEVEKVIEKLEQQQEDVKPEVVAGAVAVAAAAAAGAAAVAKKKPAAAKTEMKTKTSVASKTSAAPIKKAPSSTTASTKAPITKPAPTKPLATTKKATAPLSAAPKPAPKSTVASASTLRSKPSTTSAAAPKRPMSSTTAKPSTDSAAAKPTPAARATTLTKKPATSVAATKPLSRPTSAAVPSKTKLTNGSSTERKPLSFSASTTRAPAKPPTSLATKPNGTSMTTAARSPTKPLSSTRLSTSNVEKSSTSPIKEKLLNRSIGSATSTRSPRPTTSATTMKTVVKDVKSPTGTASKTTPSSLSAVGVKKPLSAVKKASTTTTTTTTVKKVPSKTTAVKKTTTTTTTVVQKKKIVNGDIVSEETSTTTTSGEPQLMIEEIIKDGFASELNGHTNGTAENGTAADNVQMLIDSTAD